MMRDDVIDILHAMRAPVLEPPPSDWEDGAPLRRAAVLVPLVDRSDGLTVLFCQRSMHLKRHAGEVSFPGGRIEDGESEIDAALREAEEEVALDRSHVAIQGRLDTHRAGSGYAIAPLVGIVTPPIELRPDGIEVDEAFEVPLDFLLEPANCRRESMFWRGADRWYNVFEYGPRYIWGATATVLVNLIEVLRGET